VCNVQRFQPVPYNFRQFRRYQSVAYTCFNMIGYRDWLICVSLICKHSGTLTGKLIGGHMIRYNVSRRYGS